MGKATLKIFIRSCVIRVVIGIKRGYWFYEDASLGDVYKTLFTSINEALDCFVMLIQLRVHDREIIYVDH